MSALPEPDPIRADRRRTARRCLVPEEAACVLCGHTDPTGLTLEDDHVLGAAASDEVRVWLCRNCHASQTTTRLDHQAGSPAGRHRPPDSLLDRLARALRSLGVFAHDLAHALFHFAEQLAQLAQARRVRPRLAHPRVGSMTPTDPSRGSDGESPAAVTPDENRLPIVVRAHAIPATPQTDPKARTSPPPSGRRARAALTRPPRRPGPGSNPSELLVFDTETTTDATQALTFGCWQYLRRRGTGWQCVQEGLFHPDDLATTDPPRLQLLRDHAAASTSAAGADRPIAVLTRAQFVEQVLFTAAWRGRARVVGFNLPFDLSRLAFDVGEGRSTNRGGFSLILAKGNEAKGYTERKHRPRIRIKHINATRAQISFGTATAGAAAGGWAGDFVDLRTLTFALTGRGYSLQSASEAFGVPGKANPGEHGQVTAAYIDYCRQDVTATAALCEAASRELRALRLPIIEPYAYSPASLAKATLDAMGVQPVLDRHPDTDPWLLGIAMSAFYGGRAECRIRKTAVPVRLVDFTSTYPTICGLLGTWRYISADRISTDDSPGTTQQMQQLLDTVTVDWAFDPHLWPSLVGFAQIRPDGDVLPVRAQYDQNTPSWGIGANPLTADEPLWYALPDLVASALLTGRPPTVLRAVLLHPVGTAPGLTPFTLPGGCTVDPAAEDPFLAMAEHRVRVRKDPALDEWERDRIQLFLKIASNAGAYGINAEYNRVDLPVGQRAEVTVYGNAEQPFTDQVGAPEDPGRFCYPPVAAVITAAARLLLALLERSVIDLGGSWAMADTDSMAIVATPTGGLLPCPGGSHDLDGQPAIRALPYQQVDAIRHRFNDLNPYDPQAVAEVLKAEVDAHCYAVAAKRYALFRDDETGLPRLVQASEHAPCSHGLGHLLNPIDPDHDPDGPRWIVQLWEHELAKELTPQLAGPAPDWYTRPTLSRLNATSPQMLPTFAAYNQGKPWSQRVKPFNFLMFAPGAQPPDNDQGGVKLVAPYTPARRWRTLRWLDLTSPGRSYRLSTDPSQPGRATIATNTANTGLYLTHPESKSCEPDGLTCSRRTRGVLRRRPVTMASLWHIGKEANRLDERETGQVTAGDLADHQLTYEHHGLSADWHTTVLP
ncbi:MAG: hypothetical protein JWR37_4483 [Mycobacterium sp.]|nr:hypothetical protein [Mycobacterium sp.]